MRQPKPGFTIIELLMVICIIGALLSLLLPAIVSARVAARRTACLANLSSMGKLIQIYANENRGWILRNGVHADAPGHTGIHRSWALMMDREALSAPTIPDEGLRLSRLSLFKCPAHPVQNTPSNYVGNAFVIDNAHPDGGGEVAGPVRLSAIRKPSQVMFVLDRVDQMWAGEEHYPNVSAHDLEFWMTVIDFYYEFQLPGGTDARIANSRHGTGRINALFFDGSARAVRSADLTPRDFDDGIRSRADRMTLIP
jgi:prepilin-type N-terminal cleavage/methylation domain-containing protein/prepilin-type processing-associated H-X9-DG protein